MTAVVSLVDPDPSLHLLLSLLLGLASWAQHSLSCACGSMKDTFCLNSCPFGEPCMVSIILKAFRITVRVVIHWEDIAGHSGGSWAMHRVRSMKPRQQFTNCQKLGDLVDQPCLFVGRRCTVKQSSECVYDCLQFRTSSRDNRQNAPRGQYGIVFDLAFGKILEAIWLSVFSTSTLRRRHRCLRYPFYALSMIGKCPPALHWLRYTAFVILYPIGFAGEFGTWIVGLPHVKVRPSNSQGCELEFKEYQSFLVHVDCNAERILPLAVLLGALHVV